MRSIKRTADQVGIRLGITLGCLFLLIGMAWDEFDGFPNISLIIGSMAFGILSYALSSLTVFLIEYRRVRQSGVWWQFWAEFNTTEDSLKAYVDALDLLRQVGLM